MEELNNEQDEREALMKRIKELEMKNRELEEKLKPSSTAQSPESCALQQDVFSSTECYQKKGGTTGGIIGHQYEIRMAALCALRALDYEGFHLGNNVSTCKALDDIVLQVKKYDDGIETYFIQMKYLESGKITFNYLLYEGALPKYCHSFKHIEEKLGSTTNGIIFKRANIKTSHFAFYTNAPLTYPSDCGKCAGKCEGNIAESADHFLSTNDKGNIYKFCKDGCLRNNMLQKKKERNETNEPLQDSDAEYECDVTAETQMKNGDAESPPTVEDLEGYSRGAQERMLNDWYKKEKQRRYEEEGHSNKKTNYYASWKEDDLDNFFKNFKLFTNQLPQDKLRYLVEQRVAALLNADDTAHRMFSSTFLQNITDWFCQGGRVGYITHETTKAYFQNCKQWIEHNGIASDSITLHCVPKHASDHSSI